MSSQEIPKGQETAQTTEFSLENLRTIVNGIDNMPSSISSEFKNYIITNLKLYLSSPEYLETTLKLFEQTKSAKTDQDTIALKLKTGFKNTLQAGLMFYSSFTETPTQTLINEYTKHCLLTAESFHKIGTKKENAKTFYNIIKYPSIYKPDLLEKVLTIPDKEGYLTPNVLTFLTGYPKRKIITVINEKIIAFETMIDDPTIQASISDIREFVSVRKNPLEYPHEIMLRKKRKTQSLNASVPYPLANTTTIE